MQTMNSKVLVVCAKRWSFEGRSGVSIQYLSDPDPASEILGKNVLKASGPAETYNSFASAPQIPGYFDISFSMAPGAGGKPTLRLVSARFAGAAKEGG